VVAVPITPISHNILDSTIAVFPKAVYYRNVIPVVVRLHWNISHVVEYTYMLIITIFTQQTISLSVSM
jgi:hypothetical protein